MAALPSNAAPLLDVEDPLRKITDKATSFTECIIRARLDFAAAGAAGEWKRFEAHLLQSLADHGIFHILKEGQPSLRPLTDAILKLRTEVDHARVVQPDPTALAHVVRKANSPEMYNAVETALRQYLDWDEQTRQKQVDRARARRARRHADSDEPAAAGPASTSPSSHTAPTVFARPASEQHYDASAQSPAAIARQPNHVTPAAPSVEDRLFTIISSCKSFATPLEQLRTTCVDAGVGSQWAQFEAHLLDCLKNYHISRWRSEGTGCLKSLLFFLKRIDMQIAAASTNGSEADLREAVAQLNSSIMRRMVSSTVEEYEAWYENRKRGQRKSVKTSSASDAEGRQGLSAPAEPSMPVQQMPLPDFQLHAQAFATAFAPLPATATHSSMPTVPHAQHSHTQYAGATVATPAPHPEYPFGPPQTLFPATQSRLPPSHRGSHHSSHDSLAEMADTDHLDHLAFTPSSDDNHLLEHPAPFDPEQYPLFGDSHQHLSMGMRQRGGQAGAFVPMARQAW
ncbi:hypothetical protein JCM10908_002672 [Rhodotorula pacifica]|uniref:uncharacterized protein n=1 Tax=Rhodotorula pacifica TaxID=1495444 RepID=UPI00316ED4FC